MPSPGRSQFPSCRGARKTVTDSRRIHRRRRAYPGDQSHQHHPANPCGAAPNVPTDEREPCRSAAELQQPRVVDGLRHYVMELPASQPLRLREPRALRTSSVLKKVAATRTGRGRGPQANAVASTAFATRAKAFGGAKADTARQSRVGWAMCGSRQQRTTMGCGSVSASQQIPD